MSDTRRSRQVRCKTCPSRDARDAAHARGCPALPPLSRAELLRLARNVEDGWAAKAGRPLVRAASAGA